jgi:DNA processing protein
MISNPQPEPLPLQSQVLARRARATRHDPALQERPPPAAALDRARAWLEHPRHHLVGRDDPRFPPLLRQAPDPPLALFIDGDPDALWQPAVAVVGSRNASVGGRDNARLFADVLCRAGIAVTSGLAAGIDAAAHEAALAVSGGITVAVLGTGPDVAYPRQHARLRDHVATTGAVVSEHPPGTPPRAMHFPGRNRIIAGLSLGTVVVEAALRSGALITARLAGEAGREVFAIPGSIHNPQTRGCHRLIREGVQLVEHPDEVLAGIAPLAGRLARSLGAGDVAIDRPGASLSTARASFVNGHSHHDRLWRELGHDPIPMDTLVERTGLTPAILSSMLLAMELDGRVAVEHGRYARRSTGGDAIA